MIWASNAATCQRNGIFRTAIRDQSDRNDRRVRARADRNIVVGADKLLTAGLSLHCQSHGGREVHHENSIQIACGIFR